MRDYVCAAMVAGLLMSMVSSLSAKEAPAPVKAAAAPSWEGFYVGANGGYMFGAAQLVDGSTDTGVDGAFGGFQLGYDWQSGSSVYGLAADYDLSSASRNFVGYQDSHTYIGSVHGRFGQLITPDLLIYALGGVAFSDAKDTSGEFSDTQNGLGYTIGAGLEKILVDRISLFAEYRYDRMNKVEFGGVFTGLSAICDGHELRMGLNFKF